MIGINVSVGTEIALKYKIVLTVLILCLCSRRAKCPPPLKTVPQR